MDGTLGNLNLASFKSEMHAEKFHRKTREGGGRVRIELLMYENEELGNWRDTSRLSMDIYLPTAGGVAAVTRKIEVGIVGRGTINARDLQAFEPTVRKYCQGLPNKTTPRSSANKRGTPQ